MKTLAIPYLIWGGLSGLVFVEVGSLSSISDGLRYLGITSQAPVGNSPLWYVRTLFVFMLILWPLLKLYGPQHRRMALISFAVITSVLVGFRFVIGMPASPYWFLLGCCLSSVMLGKRQPPHSRVSLAIVCVVVIPLIGARLLWGCMGGGVASNHLMELIVRNVGNVLMLMAIWFGFDLLARDRDVIVPQAAGVSFFVYCAHLPTIRLANELLSWIPLSLPMGVLYFCEASLVSVGVFCVGLVVRKWTPNIYGVLSGGR